MFQEGLPFDEDVFNPNSDPEIKSYFEDLTKKHPQFVSDLHCPPWSGSLDKDWERAYTVPISVEQGETATVGTVSASSSQSQCCSFENRSQPDPSESLSQQNLRDTVHIAEQMQKKNFLRNPENEPKCSLSAPLDSSFEGNIEPKRFTTKIEIIPINPFEPKSDISSDGNDVPPPISHDDRSYSCPRQVLISADHRPCSQNPDESTRPTIEDTLASNGSFVHVTDKSNTGEFQSLQTNLNQPQVRHIPIFVEGRTDPIIPTNGEISLEKNLFTTDQAPLKRALDGNNSNETAITEFNQNHESSQEKEIPLEIRVTSATVSQSASAPTTSLPFSVLASPSSAPVTRLDSQQCVEQVQQEVDILTKRVEQYSGTSRNDKEYLYLDEMLTRHLIKLDTIEIEGNEQLRIARKNVIKSIQKSIVLLESKIPAPTNENKSEDDSSEQIGELQPISDVSDELLNY